MYQRTGYYISKSTQRLILDSINLCYCFTTHLCKNTRDKIMKPTFFLFLLSIFNILNTVYASDTLSLPSVIKKVQPSVVGVGTLTPIEGNLAQLKGTGFVIGGGRYIATNYHVVSETLSQDKIQKRVVFVGTGRKFELHEVEIIDFDPVFDLAILEIVTDKVVLPSKFTFRETESMVEPGVEIAFTGFPIGSVLGLYPATHKGIIAAVTPDSSQANSSSQLNSQLIARLQRKFDVYQLDATAFPGNSGSALYVANSGEVIGIINKVMVQGGKEYALSSPSGITYAIPVKHLRNLATRNNISL